MSTISITQLIKKGGYSIQQGATDLLATKIKRLFKKVLKFPLYISAVPAVMLIRVIKRRLLVRVGGLISSRIGHFASNTELYLCEKDAGINVPTQPYLDIFYMAGTPVANKQLATMWRRELRIWPTWIMGPIDRANQLLPDGGSHEIGSNTCECLDVHNLLDRFPPHLRFTNEEESHGEACLRAMGIPVGAKIVCLNIRDSAYLAGPVWAYHNYRDSDVQNYVLAAEALAERGYFVVRMGAKVHAAINSSHPRVVDYATNGMRTDFMDIYLGAKCYFCVSTGTGWDALPEIFRRPIVYVNFVPLGSLHTSRADFLAITKKSVLQATQKVLTLKEIFSLGIGLSSTSSDYETKGVVLIENTPEEIRDVAIEMADRLAGSWQEDGADETLQQRFWKIYRAVAIDSYAGKPLHGDIRSRFGSAYLRDNPDWLR